MKDKSLTFGCGCRRPCGQQLSVRASEAYSRSVVFEMGIQGTMILSHDDAKVVRDWLDRYLKESQP